MACGRRAPKGTLFRVVRDRAGKAAFDRTGRAPGRGAYLCSEACLAKTMGTKRLEKALRTAIKQDDIERIAENLTTAMRDE